MPEQAVVNASPLNFVSRVWVIDLLQQAAPSILDPEMVALEVNRPGKHDPTACALGTTSRISTVAAPSVPPKKTGFGIPIGRWIGNPEVSGARLAFAYSRDGARRLRHGSGNPCHPTPSA